jgi:hypothetical protein
MPPQLRSAYANFSAYRGSVGKIVCAYLSRGHGARTILPTWDGTARGPLPTLLYALPVILAAITNIRWCRRRYRI